MSDRLEVAIQFYNIEPFLYRRVNGRASLAFFHTLLKEGRYKLSLLGGFGPYDLKIVRGDGVVQPHTLIMGERY
jgi:hypothetical protein